MTLLNRSIRRCLPLLMAVVLSAWLTGCGSHPAAESGLLAPQPAPAEPDIGVSDGVPAPGERSAASDQRRVIRSGSMTVEVDEVDRAVAGVRELADGLDGYVAAASIDGRGRSAQLTLRVPADRFEAAISAVRGLGELIDLASNEDDVTTELIDLEARLDNLRAAEANYRQLIGQAASVEETLMVQQRLDEIRGQIESLDGQRAYLERQADLATLSVALRQPVEPVTAQGEDFDPGRVLSEAVAALLWLEQLALTALIYLLVLGVPLVAVSLLLLAFTRRWRRWRAPVEPPPDRAGRT